MQQADNHEELLFKVLVIGDLATGKTSIVKRYVHNFFSQHYRSTIGVDFALKVLNWDENTIVRIQLWDIAGQERFSNMTRVYYKEAAGAIVVFDTSRSSTFENARKWKADLDAKLQLCDGKPIPCILVANKSDIQKETQFKDPKAIDQFCKEDKFTAWFETSAKEGTGINESLHFLIDQILAVHKAGKYEIPVVSVDEADVHVLNSNGAALSNSKPSTPVTAKLPPMRKCEC